MSHSPTSTPPEPGSTAPAQEPDSRDRATLERPLTDREMEILQCLPTRLSTNEIGEVLHISPNTVKTHLRSIYSKLSARSRNEAILQGAKYRLISKDSEWLVRH
jgi:LuxR family maltose regulon positive regulatory protein